MNLQGKSNSCNDQRFSVPKATLNPNAAEFVPLSLQSPAAGIGNVDISSNFVASTTSIPGKAILGRSESSASINSDEEAQQYWRHQLPDDITPDFKLMGIDDNQGINSEGLRYSASSGTGHMLNKQLIFPHLVNGNGLAEKRYTVSTYRDHPLPTGFQLRLAKPWDKQVLRNDQPLAREGPPFNGNSRHSFLSDIPNEHFLMDKPDVSPLKFLASHFPGFAPKSLEEVYFANRGDLDLTIEMLAQLEVDGGLNRALNLKAVPVPNHGGLHFPVLSVANDQTSLTKFGGAEPHQDVSRYGSSEKESMRMHKSISSIPARRATDFASPVKMATQESSIWKYDRNGSPDTSIGFPRSSQNLLSLHNSGQGRDMYGDRLESRGSAHGSPVSLGTGEAVGNSFANMYPEMREEARDHAHMRNTFLEQARQAYHNKALTKELSIKGQLHSMQMKTAHGKAAESIFGQRNPDMQVNGRDCLIDLQGLLVSEGMHVLKHELEVLRTAARLAREGFTHSLIAYIFIGTCQLTRGSQAARLRLAVQRYLMEQGLDYSEPEPGLLQVVIY